MTQGNCGRMAAAAPPRPRHLRTCARPPAAPPAEAPPSTATPALASARHVVRAVLCRPELTRARRRFLSRCPTRDRLQAGCGLSSPCFFPDADPPGLSAPKPREGGPASSHRLGPSQGSPGLPLRSSVAGSRKPLGLLSTSSCLRLRLSMFGPCSPPAQVCRNA